MEPTLIAYISYLTLSAAATVWVGRTLFQNGTPFLRDVFKDNADLADAVNKLLVVGFYLINFGYVVLALRIGGSVNSTRGIFETVSTKLGVVLLVLGAMHFFNLLVFSRIRRRSVLLTAGPPPVLPDSYLNGAAHQCEACHD